MAEIIKTTFQLRRGYDETWKKNNPILASGEPGFVLDKNLLKIGDGVTPWNNLKYINAQSGIYCVEFKEQLPEVGEVDVVYKVLQEAALYQWSSYTQKYELLTGVQLSNEQITAIEKIINNFDSLIQKVENIELKNNKYELLETPENTLVSIKENEIRIMCPKDTSWNKQYLNDELNPNNYYIGLKVYAPKNDIYGYKLELDEKISEQTLNTFENNQFAGIDEDGRKFSIVWLPVALYNEDKQSWVYYGENSSISEYFGWYFVVEWYNNNSKLVDSYSIRINLSNEDCHSNIEPYFMSNININKLTQKEGEYLILYGGSATDNI